MSYFKTLFFLILFSFSYITGENDVQPIGTLVRIWEITGHLPLELQESTHNPSFHKPLTPVEQVNYISAQWDKNITPNTAPFDITKPITEITPTEELHFVRVYNPNVGGNINGPWLMRSSEIRGLTPEQIKDKFSLLILPTCVVNVDLPVSSDKKIGLWTGVAAPIEGFGKGGGVQTRIISDTNGTNYFPDYVSVIGRRDHPQSIGEFALSYRPLAGEGTTGQVAAYLDSFIPLPYSDLENIYTYLDYLNWINYGAKPLRKALKQISPDRFHSLPWVIERNSTLLAEALLQPCKQGYQFQTLGQWGNFKSPQTNFTTVGLTGEYLHKFTQHLQIGTACGGFNNHLNWKKQQSSSTIKSLKCAVYVKYLFDYSTLASLITTGYDWLTSQRKIEFLGVDRTAQSHPHGFDFSYHVQLGYNFLKDVSSLIRLSYFYEQVSHFREHGAKSLNLHVKKFHNQTIKSYMEICLNDFKHNKINPEIHLGWAHYFSLDKRIIQSKISEIGNLYPVYGLHKDEDSLIINAGIKLLMTEYFKICTNYEAEIGSHFYFQIVRVNFNYIW